MEGSYENLTELDLHQLNYDVMMPNEFILAERRAQQIHNSVRTRNRRNKGLRTDEYIVRIYGNLYKVNDAEMTSLKRAKTPEGLDSVKAKIASSREPLQDIDSKKPHDNIEAI